MIAALAHRPVRDLAITSAAGVKNARYWKIFAKACVPPYGHFNRPNRKRPPNLAKQTRPLIAKDRKVHRARILAMTYGDVLIQILSEVFGDSLEDVTEFVNTSYAAVGRGRLDDELSDAEAEELLRKFRLEKAGVANHYIKGYKAFLDARDAAESN